MNSSQRMENLGRVSELKRRAIELSILMYGYREQINRATSPHRPIDELDTGQLGVVLDQLEKATSEHTELCHKIRSLCADLGIPVPATDPHYL